MLFCSKNTNYNNLWYYKPYTQQIGSTDLLWLIDFVINLIFFLFIWPKRNVISFFTYKLVHQVVCELENSFS